LKVVRNKHMQLQRKSFLLLISLLFLGVSVEAQYGNEWINYDQTYYKFQLAEQGIYRLTYETLDSVGVPVTSVDPRNFQLFTKGKEQAIWVEGESDGSFDPGDYIEFYGEGNDGWLDSALYRSPEEHTNPYYSLYSDSLPYFLTWNENAISRRLVIFEDTNFTAKTPDKSFVHESLLSFNTSTYTGLPIESDGIKTYSEYVDGKGFHRWNWQSQGAVNLNAKNLYTSGTNASLEVKAYTATNNTSVIVDGYNHDFSVSLHQYNNLIFSKKATGHEKIHETILIPSTDLREANRFFIGARNFSSSGIHLTYAKLSYPREFSLEQTGSLSIRTNLNSSFLKFKDCNWNKAVIWDLHRGRKIGYRKINDTLLFNLPSNGFNHLFLANELNVKTLKATNLEELVLSTPAISGADYLIISHTLLRSGAERYKAYRESVEGGGYNVQLIYIDKMYDYFSYGIHHPIALKHLLDEYNTRNNNLQHILLLGKGQSFDRVRNNPSLKQAYDLVPIMGLPASDYLFVSSLDGSILKPHTSIGRIPARDNDQIIAYLNKLKSYESNTSNGPWRKKLIHLGAGQTSSELAQFGAYLRSYYNIAKDSFLGAHRVLFSKDDAVPIQTTLEDQIQDEINDGSVLLNYFGHGAAQVLELSIGEPETLEPVVKSPLYIFNGCALGVYYEDLSLGEKFLFEPQKGPLGWIASTNFGLTSSLFSHTLEINKSLFQRKYGSTVGEALVDALDYYGNPNSKINILQSRQFVYLGDPALRITPLDRPDYIVESISVNKNYSIDSLSLIVEIRNLGKVYRDSIQVDIEITNSNGEQIFESRKNIPTPDITATLTFPIVKGSLTGVQQVLAILDGPNDIIELQDGGELNNRFTESIFFEQASIELLSPIKDAIVMDNDFELVFSVNNNFSQNTTLEYQIDTTPYFSNILVSNTVEVENSLVFTSTKIPVIDDQDFYIRYKLKGGNDWNTSTFALLFNEEEGLSQGDYRKFRLFESDLIEIDSSTRTLSFLGNNAVNYSIETVGDGNGRYQLRWMLKNNEALRFDWWPANGLFILAINPETGERYYENDNTYDMKYSGRWGYNASQGSKYYINGETTAIYHYDINDSIIEDSFRNFVHRIPEDYIVLMHNAFNCNLSKLDEATWQALEAIGVNKVKSINDGDGFAVFGQKGLLPGEATEFIPDYNDPVTPSNIQRIFRQKAYNVLAQTGSIKSNAIGPSREWEQLSIKFKNDIDTSDDFSVKIYGSSNKSDWFELRETKTLPVDLTSIDAHLYPYLTFELVLIDSLNRTPMNLDRWIINYQQTGDGIVNTSQNSYFVSDTIERGKPLFYSIDFTNLKDEEFDSSQLICFIRNNRSIDTIYTEWIDALDQKATFSLIDTIQTAPYVGESELFVTFNYNQKVIESSYSNNTFYKSFYVQDDFRNPLIDVTFDGRHIVDNDFVSPNTRIEITLKDENEFLELKDPSSIQALLQYPDESTDSIVIASNQVEFRIEENNEIALIYNAEKLPDGNYKLFVTGRDLSNNSSTENPQEYRFRVVNETTITDVLPYPNPFTTNTSFVFQLTGQELPDVFKIDIFNVSGRRIKTIDALGQNAVSIGSNVSSVLWDGTDDFGDQLANGVYLYKCTILKNGVEINRQETSTSNLFQNGFGKLYIMR
jgi:hypothetical protein